MKRTPLRRKTPLKSGTKALRHSGIASKAIPDRKRKSIKKKREAKGPHINKTSLSIPTVERIRDDAHLRFVRAHHCCICGAPPPSHAHHLTHVQPKARGLKAGDQWTVSVCMDHHQNGPQSIHGAGNEASWWVRMGLDGKAIAQSLWAETCDGREKVRRNP